MWARVLRDAELSPVVREAAEPRFQYLRAAAGALSECWPDGLARAAARHAVQFRTWQSLAAEGLSDETTARLMTSLAELAARE
jgi:hypothetical protein